MTSEEAIKILTDELKVVSGFIIFNGAFKQAGIDTLESNMKTKDAIEEAIKAIEKVQQYRVIGSVEECRKAVEKQKTKKCAINSCPDHTHYKCPSCEKIHMTRYKHGCQMGRIPRYCEYCGQAIDENLEVMEDE